MTRPLTPAELAQVALWLDLTDEPLTNTAVCRRLLATVREAERALADARAKEDAAYAMLAADLDLPCPGDFGTDPAADWPTDFPKEP